MSFNNIYKWLILIFASCLIFTFFMWRTTAVKLNNTKKELTVANETILTLTLDNKKLIEYTNKKEQEIKNIQKEYLEKVEKAPVDNCGDTKPSRELLNFLRKNLK